MAGKPNGKSIVYSENDNLEPKARGKALWDPKATKIFIDLCKADVLARNKLGTRLRNPVWKLLAPKLNELAEREFEQHQLKNKWDNLRRDWLLWKMVTNGAINIGCCSAKDDVGVDDEWWQARLKVVPKAAKFQKRAPEHLDDLEIIFSHTVANGEFPWAPNSGILPEKEYMLREKYPRLLEGCGGIKLENVAERDDPRLEGIGGSNAANKTGVEDALRVNDWQLLVNSRDSGKENISKRNEHQSMEGNENAGGDNVGVENLTAVTPTYAKTMGEDDERKKHRETDHEFNSEKKEKKARTIQGVGTFSNELDRNCEVVESMSSAKSSATSMMTRLMGSSIAEVMDLMDSMPDIEPAGELYMLGTRLFIRRANREMFVALKTPRVRMAWLRQELGREGQTKPNG